MMDFNLNLLKMQKETKVSEAAPTPKAQALFSELENLTSKLAHKNSSFLTPLSVPRYIDFVAEDGRLVVTENFSE